MVHVESCSTVLVTGANGFIALHLIRLLLTNGYHVRGTVRCAQKASSVLSSLKSPPSPLPAVPTENLKIVVLPSLESKPAMVEAMRGCVAVLHLASAFTYAIAPEEFETKLFKPAIIGTEVVCEAADEVGVERLVLMSSFAAVYDAAKGLAPEKTYSEEDWSPLTKEDTQKAMTVPEAYRASKVLAESAAWAYVSKNEASYDLICLCPGMVFGPLAGPVRTISELNESNQIVWGVVKGGQQEIPDTRGPVWVDVFDLALICLRALELSERAHRRYLAVAGTYCNQEIADIVRAKLPESTKRIPVGEPGVRLAHRHFGIDNRKVKRDLGIEFTSLEQSILPLVEQLYVMEMR